MESKLEINVSEKTNFSSLPEASEFCNDRFGHKAMGKTKELVTICRIDEFLWQEVPDIESWRLFLKLDTQGYDLEAFKGAAGILDEIFMLQTEVSLIPLYNNMPHWTECMAVFEQHGFGTLGMFPVARDRDSGLVIEYDCLLAKAPASLSQTHAVALNQA